MMARSGVFHGRPQEPLMDRLKDKPLSVQEALLTAIAVGEALKRVEPRGRAFGQIHPSQVSFDGPVAVLSAGSTEVTAYMSPEQARGERCDERSDVFSLGTLLYRMLSGRDPFKGGKPGDLRRQILHSDPAPLNHIPGQLARTLRLCLEKRRERRFQHLRILLAELKLQALRSGTYRIAQETREEPPDAPVRAEIPGPVPVPKERAATAEPLPTPRPNRGAVPVTAHCPKCGSPDVRESRPRSTWERLAVRAGVSLQRCHRCCHRFVRLGPISVAKAH
jgi:hypothetical protein